MADVRLTPTAQQTLDQHSRPEEPSAVFKPTDMSNWAQIHALWDFALQTYGRVNIVVNGAGVYEPPSSTFWNPPGASTESSSLPLIPGVAAPEDDPDAAVGQYKTFAVNMTGPIRLAQLAVQYWLEHREVGGNLLWFASLAGYLHGMITPLYFSSKAAVVSMCKSLGGLRETRGVRNACICPGTVHVGCCWLSRALHSPVPYLSTSYIRLTV